jgi:protocatechuate 3,4-dioxygenase beta subunit
VRYLIASILWSIFAFAQAPDVKPDDKCSVEGTVIDSATGEPVKKAWVTLEPVTPRANPYATTADAAGHFLIDEVDAGRFTLMASHSGYTQPISPHGGPKPSLAFTLEKGQKMKEIELKLAPEGVISGRILDADGDPLEGVNIECMSIKYERGKPHLVASHRTNVNELGEFRLPRLAAGKYIIRATHFDEIPTQERLAHAAGAVQAAKEKYVTTYYPSTMNSNNASPIEVSPGAQIAGITITLMRTRTFSIKGHVDSGSEKSWRRSRVRLWPRGELQPGGPRGTEVDAQGRFQFDGVAPGSYVLFAGDEHTVARMPLEVHDENIEGIELSPQPNGEIVVRATVEGDGGLKYAPREFSRTSRTSGESGTCLPEDDSPCKFSDTGDDGPYDVLPIGLSIDFYVKSARLGEQDVLDTGFEFTPGVTGILTLVLNPNSGQMEGSVTNAKDEPAVGVKVTLVPGGSPRSPTRYKTTDTDQNGHFVIKGLAPGEYKIYAWEDLEQGAEQDPDFMKPHESDGEKVSIKERAHETVQLKLIPAESAASEKPSH